MNEKTLRTLATFAYVGACAAVAVGYSRWMKAAAAREQMAMIDQSVASHLEAFVMGGKFGLGISPDRPEDSEEESES